LVIFFSYRKIRKLMEQHPKAKKSVLNYLWILQAFCWMFAYIWSTLFHIHENKITERMDYFCAVLLWVSNDIISIIRIFKPKDPKIIILIMIPFFARGGYFLYYMNFVEFDYGWTIEVVAGLVVVHAILWIPWCFFKYFKEKRAYCIWNLVSLIGLACALPLEIFDFIPLFGHFDGHGLWHLAGCFIIHSWMNFAVGDVAWRCSRYKQDQLTV